MLRYPVTLKKDSNGTLLVTTPDFPDLVTFGESKADASCAPLARNLKSGSSKRPERRYSAITLWMRAKSSAVLIGLRR